MHIEPDSNKMHITFQRADGHHLIRERKGDRHQLTEREKEGREKGGREIVNLTNIELSVTFTGDIPRQLHAIMALSPYSVMAYTTTINTFINHAFGVC